MRRHRVPLLLAVLLTLLSTPFGLEAQSQEFTWNSFESFEIVDVPASSSDQLLRNDPLGNRWAPSPLTEATTLGLQEEDGGLGFAPCLALSTGAGALLGGLMLARQGDEFSVGAILGGLGGLVLGLPICALAT